MIQRRNFGRKKREKCRKIRNYDGNIDDDGRSYEGVAIRFRSLALNHGFEVFDLLPAFLVQGGDEAEEVGGGEWGRNLRRQIGQATTNVTGVIMVGAQLLGGKNGGTARAPNLLAEVAHGAQQQQGQYILALVEGVLDHAHDGPRARLHDVHDGVTLRRHLFLLS
jgi:hypothetical protein